jgi:hypothetical protein
VSLTKAETLIITIDAHQAKQTLLLRAAAAGVNVTLSLSLQQHK